MRKFQNDVNSKVADVTIGYTVCDQHSGSKCKDESVHFPRIKFFDFKKELDVNITQENLDESFIKIKNYAVPRILLVKSEVDSQSNFSNI